MPWRSYETEYPPRNVACSGSPRILRMKPLCTFGRHARLMFGATLFQSLSYPCVFLLNWMNSGSFVFACARLLKLHLLNALVFAPGPDRPQMESNATAAIVSFTATNGDW